MKSILSVACAVAVLLGCTVNGSTPVTAWGRKDVSMIDYRTDAGQCAVLAATTTPDSNAAKTAGGINGENGGAPPAPQASGAATAAAGGSTAGSGGTPSVTGGTYRDSASADFVNRAAMQQRTQEMAAQRVRTDALKSCLAGRGYTEFELTAAQRDELSKLPQGSDARRDYLYKLGTDPEVLSKQSTIRK
ncbi:MAG: hypothetical protein ABI821_13100 [Pseudomonadota bacterium]